MYFPNVSICIFHLSLRKLEQIKYMEVIEVTKKIHEQIVAIA